MSSDKYCCVPGCRESGGMHKVLHGFPNPEKDKKRFNEWLYTIGNDILGLENERIYKYRRVCHAHFKDEYLCRNNKISNIAVPTLHIQAPLSLKSSSGNIKSMETILNMKNPSTSSDPKQFRCEYTSHTSINIGKDISGKENIAPKGLTSQEAFPSNTADSNIKGRKIPAPKGWTSQDPFPSNTANLNIKGQQIYAPKGMTSQETVPSNTANSDTKSQQILGKKEYAHKITKKRIFTKSEREMYNQIVAARIKLSKLKNKVKKQSAHIKAAKKLANNPAAMEVFENCSSTAKLLMQIQWRENKKKEKGRRFTLEEKITALSILKQSATGYRFLRNLIILPAEQTLIKLIQRCNLKPGINKNIFSQLKNKAKDMKPEQKLCVVLFDEVSLKPNVTYQERKDRITGFVDNGHQRITEFADHAQVFMVRGLVKNYKQAVYYTFSKSATKGPELAVQLKEVVRGLQEAGLIVVATVCDQGTNNRQALRILLNETRGVYLRRGEEVKENIILIDDQEIIPLYDPPHLLKGIRNNLLTKNLKYTTKEGVTKTAKWSHLQQLYKENPGYKGIRLIPKLTENHVNPEKLNKMKVKFASQIFSRTVASNLGYLADKGILPAECKETADFRIFMDNIFDSVNGSYMKNKHAKPLLGPATPNSVHHKTWEEGINMFQTMVFETSAGKREIVPTVANWLWTLKGINILLKKLNDDFKVTSVWLRHLNQDPLENFFGAVRSHGCRNTNPTCDQFESAFATLLINNLNSVHNRGKNCEADFCDALHTLITNKNVETESTCTFDFASIINFEFTPVESKENDPRIIAPIQYMSGYFFKKAKSNIFKSCADCNAHLSSSHEIEYIQYREYAGRRWLCTPSNELIKLISNMQDVINQMIRDHFEHDNFKEILKTAIVILVDFTVIQCNVHKNKLIDYLISIVIRCLTSNYCKNINQILSGRRQVDDDEDKWQMKAQKFHKCFKRHHK